MKYFWIFIFVTIYQLTANDWIQVKDIDGDDNLIKSISCPDSNNCFVLAQSAEYSRLFKSVNQGKSWSLIFQSDPFNEESPTLVNAETGMSPHPDYYFMSMWEYPIIKKSSDGGYTFRRYQVDTLIKGTHRKIDNLTMLDTNTGFASSGDFIYITHDGWQTNQKYAKILYEGYYSPLFINDSIVAFTFASSVDSVDILFKNYNINNNKMATLYEFKNINNEDYQLGIISIDFVDELLGFGCGHQRTGLGDNSIDFIYRTTDGGYSWELKLKKLLYPSYGLQDIAFHDAKNGVAVGQGGKIWTTNDSGNTWISNEIPEEMTAPLTMKVAWAGQHPITGTYDHGGGLFRYEGDFFDFSPDTTEDTTSVRKKVKDLLGDIEIQVQQSGTRLYISIEDETFRKYTLQISDILGNILKTKELNSGIGTLYVPVDLTALQTGTYLYMFSTGGVVAKTGKVIVVK